MLIRFDRNLDDVIAFSDFHHRHSPTMKRFLAWYRGIGALFILLVPMLIIQQVMPDMPILLSFLISSIGAVLFAANASGIIQRRLRRQARKLYNEGRNDSMKGEATLELTDTGLIARSEYTETKMAWGAIERIESTPDYTFLYISSVSAYVIPHNKIIEGDYRAFMAEIGRKFQPGQRLQQTIA